MNIKSTPIPVEVLPPLKLELTLDSVQEMRAIYAIFTHVNNANLIGDTFAETIANHIADHLDAHGEDCEEGLGIITNGVRAGDFYK